MSAAYAHCACGKQISPRTKSGKCAKCAAADPAVRAKKGKLPPEQRARRAEQARRLSADPAIVEKRSAATAATMSQAKAKAAHAEACARSKHERMKDPEFREKLVQAGREVGSKNIWKASTPEARAKAREAIRRAHLAWCPEEHWELNQKLKRAGYRLEERKQIIAAETPGTTEHARREIENRLFAQRLRQERERAEAY